MVSVCNANNFCLFISICSILKPFVRQVLNFADKIKKPEKILETVKSS